MTPDQQEKLSSACYAVRSGIKEEKLLLDAEGAALKQYELAIHRRGEAQHRLREARSFVNSLVKEFCEPIVL